MKKLTMIVLMTLATAGHAFAGGPAAVTTTQPLMEPVAQGGTGGLVAIGVLLVAAGLASATSSTSGTTD